MANRTFIRNVVIGAVVGALVEYALERWFAPWPPILQSVSTWAVSGIASQPDWVWTAIGVCVGLGVFSLFLVGMCWASNRAGPETKSVQTPSSNLVGITRPIVCLNGTLLDGCVAFNRTGEPYEFDNPYMMAELFEAVVEVDSPAVQLLKRLIPPRDSHGIRRVEPTLHCDVRDSTGQIGYIFDGACLDFRGYQSAHIGFLFAFGRERVV